MSTSRSNTKKRTLNQKFAFAFTLLLAILFTVLLVAVQIIAQVYTNKYVENDVVASHKDVQSEFTDVLNEINYGYTRIVQNERISELSQNVSYEEKKLDFERIISDSALSDDYLNVVLRIGNEVFSLSDDFDLPTESFAKTLENGGNGLFFGAESKDGTCVQIGRRLQNPLYAQEGYAVFYVSQKKLDSICLLATSSNGVTRVLDSDYKVIASSQNSGAGDTIFEKENYLIDQKDAYRKQINGKKCLVAITPVDNQYDMGLYVVSEVEVVEIQKNYIVLSIVLACIALVTFVVAIVVSIRLAKRTAEPINNLSKELGSVDFSNERTFFNIGKDSDEIYELERSYNEMLERLYGLMEENKQNMETQRKLEIDALQMQINPHFLYNTLDAIAWMSKIKKQPEIEKLVINLAKFFRLSLHKGAKYVKISEEAELVEHFLEIEKIRFPDTIRFVNEIPESIGNYTTIKLILQPIVENSIKHGFVEKDGIGTITLGASEEGDDVLITVSDDGCGFDVPDDFWSREINPQAQGGYGLRNVNERIRLEYGEGYGLSVESQKGVGTKVMVRIKKGI